MEPSILFSVSRLLHCRRKEAGMKAKQLWRILLGTVLVLGLAACSPAGSAAEKLVEKDAAGSTLTLSVDQVLAVKLESNPTTGYGWHLVEVDETILQSQGDAEYIAPEDSGTPGGGLAGWEVLRFKACRAARPP
jgi:predicted secreted protein